MSPKTAEENKDLVLRAAEALNERDRETFTRAYADDAVFRNPVVDLQGNESIAEYLWGVFEAFPDLTFTIDQILAENDLVAVRGTETGTHEGEFRGIDPTGNTISFAAHSLYRIGDGQIAEQWFLGDLFGLMQQLEVIEPPEG